MKSGTSPAAMAIALSAAATSLCAQPVVAQDRPGAATVNLICGKDDADDTYYSEVTLNEEEGIATFVRRSNSRTIGPDRMAAIFTPTDVQFEELIDRRTGTKEVFIVSRVDLTMTRWLEASFSQGEPRRTIIQCTLSPVPVERAF